MKKLLAALCLVLAPLAAHAQSIVVGNPGLGFTPEQVFNISDSVGGQPGAVCDGVTNDDAAINRTFAAAAASNAYTNNDRIKIVGPANGSQKGCVYNSLNLTGFTSGTGANTRPQVDISNLTLLCTGAGNICVDALGANLIKMHDVSIRGNTAPNSPEICIQVGTKDGTTSSAWHNFERVNCNNEFALTAYYNVGSEANTLFDSMMVNAHTASGPIAQGGLGSITGGSSYTNGTYTSVPLTGGSGTSALATVVVAGNAVTSVTLTYQGRDYAVGDTLSASAASLGGTGSGFSVPVSSVHPYVMLMDGQNYWRVASAFATVTTPVNAWLSQTLVTMIGGSVRQLGSGGALWLGWNGGMKAVGAYILNNSGASCVELFDNGVTKGGIPGPNWGLDLEFNCEGASLASAFNLTGANATPSYSNLRWKGYHQGTTAAFTSDSNITSYSLPRAAVDLDFSNNSSSVPFPMFASAKIVSGSGIVRTPLTGNWNEPASGDWQVFVASLNSGASNVGPVDIFPSAAFAWSCERRLNRSYKGALCRLQRASDSATFDVFPMGNGFADHNAENLFCNATTCSLAIKYDQSGNSNNCTQATAANQFGVTIAVATANSRTGVVSSDTGALACSAAAAASINDLFQAGGYVMTVVMPTSTASAADRLLYKSNGGTIGWGIRNNFVGSSYSFDQQGYATTQGVWTYNTALSLNVPHVVDIQYNAATLSNVPTPASDGSNMNQTAATQPVGSYTTDGSQALFLGNTALTGGNRGYPGTFFEEIGWKAIPGAAVLEALRRNAAPIYGIGSTVN